MTRNLKIICLLFAFSVLGFSGSGPSHASTPASEEIQHKVCVRNAIGKEFRSVAGCLEDFSSSNPEIKEVDLRFVVWTNGQIYNIKINPKDRHSEECIEKLLKNMSVPLPEKPRDYSFRIDLDAHVRHVSSNYYEVKKDAPEKDESSRKRLRRHNLGMDLLTPIVTSSMDVGTVFLFEYEIAINRWAALSFSGMAGSISMNHEVKVYGQSYEGTIEGRGGGGGGGIRFFPIGNANRGLIFGAQARAYMFKLGVDECPPEVEKSVCEGEIKNLDLFAEAGWRFVMPFGMSILVSGEAGAQFGRSLFLFESDPAPWFGGKFEVGWSF